MQGLNDYENNNLENLLKEISKENENSIFLRSEQSIFMNHQKEIEILKKYGNKR